MDLDFIIFPAPKQTQVDHAQGQILWIPKYYNLYPDFKDYIVRKNKKQCIFFVQPDDFDEEHFTSTNDDSQGIGLQQIPHFKWEPRNKNRKETQEDISSPIFENENSPQTLSSKIDQLNSFSVKTKMSSQQMDYVKLDQKFSERKISVKHQTISRSQPLIKLPEKLDMENRKRRNSQKGLNIGHIPCMYVDSGMQSAHVLIYFHSNAEDIGLSYNFLMHLRNNFQVSVIAVEYPGYGLYNKSSPNAESILNDAEYVYNYLTKRLGFEEQNIIIFGRSIGSGPATYLASKYQPGCLALMSPFTSLKAVIRDYIGFWASVLVKQRFDNLENIKNVNSPIFILHGLNDDIIPYRQAQELESIQQNDIEQNPRVVLHLAEEMDHISYRLYSDLINPFTKFLLDIKYFKNDSRAPKWPTMLFREPLE